MSVLSRLWALPSLDACRSTIKLLADRHLLYCDGDIVRLHDNHVDALLRTLGDGALATRHVKLIEAYRATLAPSSSWSSLAADAADSAYIVAHLIYHMVNSGSAGLDEARRTVLDLGWIDRRTAGGQCTDIVQDIVLVEARAKGTALSDVDARLLKLARQSLRLASGHFTSPADLHTQLIGRLLGHRQPQSAGHRLMTQWRQQARSQGIPFLEPINQWRTQAGGALEMTLIGHTSPVCCIAIAPDGKRVVSDCEIITVLLNSHRNSSQLALRRSLTHLTHSRE
jgi:hypothetical protein